MKISFLTPRNQYRFFEHLVPCLERAGHRVEVNGGLSDCDLAIATMLPQTPEWVAPLRLCGRPFVLWHWDQFSFVDYGSFGWRGLFELLPRAVDVWSASYDTGGLLKASHELESFIVGSFVVPEDFPESIQSDGDYVLYCAPRKAFHKRVDWFELAARRLGLEFRSTYQGPTGLSRVEYCKLVAGCRMYVVASFEESNATIPALEAALCRKAVVLSDLPACREEFGNEAIYFAPWSFGALLAAMRKAMLPDDGRLEAARERVLRLFSLERIGNRIRDRLKELELRL